MCHLLYIARHRDATMQGKVDLLATQHGFRVRSIVPAAWRDEFLNVRQQGDAHTPNVQRTVVPFIGNPTNPHRATYRTLGFGIRRFNPQVILAEEEPDSLAALHVAAARALFARQAKLILYTWQNVARPMNRLVRLVTRVTLGQSSAVMCGNSEAVELLRARGYRKPTAVIPASGVDTKVFTPCVPDPGASSRFVVGYAGRLIEEKGLDTLIDAVAMMNPIDVRLAIIGDGAHRSVIQQHLIDAGWLHRTTFYGALPPAEVAKSMCDFSVLVLPSRATPVWKEQFGRVLIEAMACGVPVVGAASGAIPEVMGDAGMTFPEGDARALSECLLKLKSSAKLRHDLSLHGLERVRAHYTQERVAETTSQFIRAVLAA